MQSRGMKLSRAEWASHVRQWRRSGETAKRYCKEHGLKESTFRYWTARIRKEDVGEGGKSGGGVRLAAVRRRRPSPSAPASPGSGVRVKVGAGEVELWRGFDEETLERAVRVLSKAGAER